MYNKPSHNVEIFTLHSHHTLLKKSWHTFSDNAKCIVKVPPSSKIYEILILAPTFNFFFGFCFWSMLWGIGAPSDLSDFIVNRVDYTLIKEKINFLIDKEIQKGWVQSHM